MRRAVAPLLIVGSLVAGCGESGGSSTDASTPPASPTATVAAAPGGKSTKTEAPAKPATVDEGVVRKCLETVGYKLSAAGNATRVQSPAGKLIANLQFFSSAAKAEEFATQLEVDGVGGPRAVAIFLRDADDRAKRVVASCVRFGK